MKDWTRGKLLVYLLSYYTKRYGNITKMPYFILRSASKEAFNAWEKLSDRFIQNLSKKILFYIKLNSESPSLGKLGSVIIRFHPVLSSQRKLTFQHFLHETST